MSSNFSSNKAHYGSDNKHGVLQPKFAETHSDLSLLSQSPQESICETSTSVDKFSSASKSSSKFPSKDHSQARLKASPKSTSKHSLKSISKKSSRPSTKDLPGSPSKSNSNPTLSEIKHNARTLEDSTMSTLSAARQYDASTAFSGPYFVPSTITTEAQARIRMQARLSELGFPEDPDSPLELDEDDFKEI